MLTISVNTLIWLFPVAFMLHEFEEILFMKPWIKRNVSIIVTRFPFLAPRFNIFVKGFSTRKFTLIVAEEFIIVSVVTFVSVEWSHYNLFAGVLMAYALHQLVHLVQFVVYRRYIPAVVTTIITAPYVVYAIFYMLSRGIAQVNQSLMIGLMAFVVIAINLAFGHWFVRKIKF